MYKNAVDKSQWGGEVKFNNLLADIRARRAEFEEQRYISQDIIEQFKDIGIYRSFVPESFGGGGNTPSEFLKAIEAISAADGSAGWVASFGMNPAYLAALPKETLDKVWGESPDIVFAGGVFPPQHAEKVDGGFIVNGRWQWGSGCMGASLLGVGIMPGDGSKIPKMAVLPAKDVTIEHTWNVHGMVGTGSFDLVVDNVFVPEEWTFIRGGTPSVDSAFFKYPSLSFASQVLAVTALGIAREAIDVVVNSAKGRKSVTGAPNLGERHYAQIDIAKAEAKLRSSRAFFYEATDEVWDAIVRGETPTPQQVSLVRLATTNVARECAEATRIAYQLTGMQGAYLDHPLSRCFRDAHLVTQHAFMGEVTYQNAGAMMFGHQPFPGYL
ncbi:acyl-CoA dehydrogenase family protein [Paraglaciecola chathamensis]|uniref:Acyl-CoA dehydrogenase type 2 domain n=1 Tax=Paraglaciecola agarilytica NO2 TaxID=1125747 RepID=A0ABQ0I8V9_9ALTE|nr:acyl-CoA dehydrogenase family protein [Paraglaciecola agarilytica]GAC05713.1 acyl-CoA dehydrogenase type 2 domain [Paraglaciecola agarilytica NO2]|tara:strand:- start:1337 stop:2485 length:1149 start_codon:yes stop_codon:yes gene_type:complete